MPDTINKIVLPDNSEHVLEDGTLRAGEGIEIIENPATGERTITLSTELFGVLGFESSVSLVEEVGE